MNILYPDAIKYHATPIDENGINREYFVYPKDGKFIVECVEWKKKDDRISGGSPEWHQEFENEEDATKKYKEILEEWESGDIEM